METSRLRLAARCAVAALPHRRLALNHFGATPPLRGAAPNRLQALPEGRSPSAHQAASRDRLFTRFHQRATTDSSLNNSRLKA